jgi:catechol 2,3-dioxygenase-like lactoylglutathione lyase family enzyme
MIRSGGFTHVHLVVRDLARSTSFYRTAFGAEEIFRMPDTVFMKLPGTESVIALRQAETQRGIDHFGLGFDEGDMDAAIERVETAGGTLVERGERMPGMPFAYLADPDGNVLELEPSPRMLLQAHDADG